MDIVKNPFISEHILHIILLYMSAYDFKANHHMIITRYNFFLPQILALKIHEAFSNHRRFDPGGFLRSKP